ncbi:MAG: DUF222 domain-containing protein [Acidimicrobiia bacterium]
MSNTRSDEAMAGPHGVRPAEAGGGLPAGLPPALAGVFAGLDGPGLLALVHEGMRALAGQVLTVEAVDDVELAGSVEALRRVETMAHGELLRRVEEVRQRGAHETVGSRSTLDFLSDRLGLTRGEARQVEGTAKALAQLPKTAAKLRDGVLGAGQASLVAAKLQELAGGVFHTASPAQAAALDDLVAGHTDQAASVGRRLDRRELRVRIDEAAEALRPGILEEREARLWRQRGLRMWDDPDGALNIQGRFDALGSAVVRTALNTLARPTGAEDSRDAGQRAADAMVELARRALDTATGLPETGGQRPHVLLVTTPEALAGLPEADPSLLDGYGPVSSTLAVQLRCDAETTQVSIARNGAVLDVGRARRDPTRAQRAAVIARDKACVGCGAPVSRCQIHHIRYWSQNGLTDLDNLVLVCWTCHRRIHHDRWQVLRDPATGRFTLQPPHTATGTGTGIPEATRHRRTA